MTVLHAIPVYAVLRLQRRNVRSGMCARMLDRRLDDVLVPFQAASVVHHNLGIGMLSTSEGLTPHKIPYFTDLSWWIYDRKFVLIDSKQPAAMTKSQALQSNLDVDYVISYRFAKTGMRHVKTLEGNSKLTPRQTRPKLLLNSRSCAMPSPMWVCRRKPAMETTTRCCSSFG